MNGRQRGRQKGFTIIEVVLVLAIAGLIFLMVFIALPALQRSQRDTQRRNDLSRVQTAVQSYKTNARGALPTDTAASWSTFKTNYLVAGGDSFTDPNGTDYTIVSTSQTPFPDADPKFTANPRNIYATIGAKCAGDGSTIDDNQGARKIAFRMILEGGGVACISD